MASLYDYGKKRAMQNYLDAEVREFAELHGLGRDETWELRVTTLARMLSMTLSERQSNSDGYLIDVPPVGDCWSERLIGLIDERTRVMSQEEYLEKHGE